MVLISCPECGKGVSSKYADICPHCTYKFSKNDIAKGIQLLKQEEIEREEDVKQFDRALIEIVTWFILIFTTALFGEDFFGDTGIVLFGMIFILAMLRFLYVITLILIWGE